MGLGVVHAAWGLGHRGALSDALLISAMLWLGAMLLGACGSDDAPAVDGGATGDGGAIDGVDEPDIPWLEDGAPPIDMACAEGWREVVDASGVMVCDPYPEGGALDCPAGQAHFVGEPDCVPVGAACPPGDFAQGLPVDRNLVYVQPGASGGDGREAAPYGSVADFSLGSLPMGTVIALSRGVHEGPIPLRRGYVLQGACAEATVVQTAAVSMLDGVVSMRADGEVRDLTITDSPRVGVLVIGAGVVGRLEGVVVAGVDFTGVAATEGAQLIASSLAVGREGGSAMGMIVDVGAAADVSRAVFSHNSGLGVLALGEGTTLTLADVLVGDTQSRIEDGGRGRGLQVEDGPSVEVSRTLFVRNREIGVGAAGEGTAVTLADVIVRDTQSLASNLERGRGLTIDRGATAGVSRALLSGNRDVAVLASDEGSAVTLADVVVRDTGARERDNRFGSGLTVQRGATLELSKALVVNNRELSVFANDAGTGLSMVDVVVRDTAPAANGQFGRAIYVQSGATGEVTRGLVERSHEAAVAVVLSGSTLALTDVVIRDTESRPLDGFLGRALSVQEDGAAVVRRARLSRSHDMAVGAFFGATASFEHVVIEDTQLTGCAETTCAGVETGHGVGSYGLGSSGMATSVRMSRFVVRGSALCGVQVADGGQLDLEDGEISDNAIGACVQVDGYDTERLSVGVRYRGNGVNLQATTLPVPSAAELGLGI